MAVIRRAEAADAAALTRLAIRSKAHWGYDAAAMRVFSEELRIKPEDLASRPSYLLEADSRILGFYTLAGGERLQLYLEHLFVDPTELRRGHGRCLLAHTLGVALAAGYERVIVWSDPHSEGFYRRCGGEAAGRVPSNVPGRELPVLLLHPRTAMLS